MLGYDAKSIIRLVSDIFVRLTQPTITTITGYLVALCLENGIVAQGDTKEIAISSHLAQFSTTALE